MSELGWFGQRFMPYTISELVLVPSEQQLKAAAKLTAQVQVFKGRLEARVSAGGAQRETAQLKVRPLTDKEWRKVIDTVAPDHAAMARLISGQFGPEVEAAFGAAGAPLFPELDLGAVRCTCREGNGCRHVLALLLTAAVHLDENPYLWLEVLGRPRAGLLAALQARRKDEAEAPPSVVADEPENDGGALREDRFWSTPVDPAAVPVRPGGEGAAPDSLLRRLGPLPLEPEQAAVELLVERGSRTFRQARRLDEVLRDFVTHVGEAAGALARGDLPPRYTQEGLPGKPVPAAARIGQEIEAVLRAEDGWLTVDDLARRCPTAAGMPDPRLSRSAVQEALASLPEGLVTVGGRHICRREAALAGAAFRHVITWDEQVRGALTREADWVRALAACGAAPDPDLFGALQARVGDELWLHVTDPVRPVLNARLNRREVRQPVLDEGAPAAARELLRHLTQAGQLGVAQAEAVGVLLAREHYRRRPGQDEAWLLPLYQMGLEADRKGRYLIAGQHAAPPAFGRRAGMVWHERDQVLRRFRAEMAAEPSERYNEILTVVEAWCRHWPGPQDRAESAPKPAALMEFLWIRAPQSFGRFQAALPTEALERWFRLLAVGAPGAYDPHLAVCRDDGAYATRLRTLQAVAGDGGDAAMQAWLLEGYRWIGESRCWTTER